LNNPRIAGFKSNAENEALLVADGEPASDSDAATATPERTAGGTPCGPTSTCLKRCPLSTDMEDLAPDRQNAALLQIHGPPELNLTSRIPFPRSHRNEICNLTIRFHAPNPPLHLRRPPPAQTPNSIHLCKATSRLVFKTAGLGNSTVITDDFAVEPVVVVEIKSKRRIKLGTPLPGNS
jgi:hypothetical protein